MTGLSQLLYCCQIKNYNFVQWALISPTPTFLSFWIIRYKKTGYVLYFCSRRGNGKRKDNLVNVTIIVLKLSSSEVRDAEFPPVMGVHCFVLPHLRELDGHRSAGEAVLATTSGCLSQWCSVGSDQLYHHCMDLHELFKSLVFWSFIHKMGIL